MNQTAARNLISIFNIPLEERWSLYLGKDHFNYYQYFEDLNIAFPSGGNYDNTRFSLNHPGLQTYLRKNTAYYEVQQMNGKAVADAGCGWGFLAFWFLLNGASKVYALGFPYQIEFIGKLYSAALSRNLIPEGCRLFPLAKPVEEGDETLGHQLVSELDYVTFNDVFEHIHDELFAVALKSSFNSLRKGGKIISATHNTDNSLVLNRTKTYWKKLEDEYISAYRRKLILEQLPGIGEAECELMVRGTQGMTMKSFNRALAEYREKKKIPPISDIKPAVDLQYDYICENWISPPKVIQQMKNAGFVNCFCYPQLRHSRRLMPFWPVEKSLAGILMKVNALSQTVIFYGEKP